MQSKATGSDATSRSYFHYLLLVHCVNVGGKVILYGVFAGGRWALSVHLTSSLRRFDIACVILNKFDN